MPFVKVVPADLIIGGDYVLTHIGCASRMAGEQLYKRVPSHYAETELVPDCTIVDNVPPSSKGLLEKAYKSWKAIEAEKPGVLYGWRSKTKNPSAIGDEKEYRKRAFYAGVNVRGGHVFTQIRGFGSKGTAFLAVNAKEVEKPSMGQEGEVYPKYRSHSIGPGGLWVVWKESVAASVKRNRAVEPLNNVLKVNANLLGLNNKPKMTNAKNNTLKARNNWLKLENRGQELKGLFGGSKTRRTKRLQN